MKIRNARQKRKAWREWMRLLAEKLFGRAEQWSSWRRISIRNPQMIHMI